MGDSLSGCAGVTARKSRTSVEDRISSQKSAPSCITANRTTEHRARLGWRGREHRVRAHIRTALQSRAHLIKEEKKSNART